LADVSGAKLSDTLDGIASKSHIMDQLEKLIIRWNLLSSQILVAAPFVGHQWLKPEEQLKIWEWLLKILDAGKTVFLTRGATWNSYKKAMPDAGLPAEVLEDLGLASRIVARKATKQDFHAKFFAGIGEESCEVLSGSANLLRGDSVENMSFKSISTEAFARRYVDRLNLKEPLPGAAAVDRRWLLIDEGESGWRARQRFSEAYLAD
jgi:hypothetical protein